MFLFLLFLKDFRVTFRFACEFDNSQLFNFFKQKHGVLAKFTMYIKVQTEIFYKYSQNAKETIWQCVINMEVWRNKKRVREKDCEKKRETRAESVKLSDSLTSSIWGAKFGWQIEREKYTWVWESKQESERESKDRGQHL